MTQTIGTRSRAALGGIPSCALFLWMALAPQAALWSQTYPNIGVEAGPARPTGFIDAFKDQGRLFLTLAQSSNAPTDASGNPTTDGIAIVFDNRPFPAWSPPVDDPANDQPNPSGTYTVAFTGTATLNSVSGYAQLTFSNQTYHATSDGIVPANTTTVNVYMPGGATYADGPAIMAISFTNTKLNGPSDPNVGDGIANLQVIRPGFTLTQAANPTQVFDPAFVNALAPFGYLRFMNWLGTNTNPYYGTTTTPVINWADRSLPTDSFQGLGVGIRHGAWGLSWEYVILLANAANKDVWINIPINATGSSDPLDPTYVPSPDTSSYVYNLAYLFKNGNAFTGNKGLNPGLHIYLEHSNEVWNSGFLQFAWNQGAAQAEGCKAGSLLCNDGDSSLTDWQTRRHLKRLYEISQIFQSVFGAGSLNTTIRPVYTWFQFDEGAGSGAANALAWFNKTYGPPSNYLYAMAQGDYFTNANWANDTTIDQVLQDMQSGSQDSISYAQQNLATAKQFGLPLFVYEGGPGTYNGGANSTTNIGVQLQANRQFAANDDIHIGMDLLVKNHIANNWFALGGSNFGYFQFSSGYSRYGAWGATDDYCNLSTAKYSALLSLTGYNDSVPATPQSLTATTSSQNVILTWPAITGAANYTVQRGSASSGPFTTLGTACTPGYTDLAVTNGNTYFYVVSAVNATGQSSGPSSPVSATPSGSQQSQTISFTQPSSPVAYGISPITLSATASSGLPITFSIVSGPGTVSGSTLTITAAGTVVVAANQPGNASYSAATQVNRTVVVTSGSPVTQIINFTPPLSPVTYPASPITLSATASSGLPVTFSIVSGPGTVSGTTLTVTATGTIVIAANQSGNANYSPAAQVTQSVVVNSAGPGTQTINFTQPSSPVAYGVSPIALSATASSGLPVTFSIVSGPGTVSASTLTVTGTGTIVVAANQSGNTNYSPAAQVTRSVVVNSGSGGSGGGTLLAYEPFGEASGTALNGVTGSGDSGWQGAWVEQFGSVAKPGYEILSTTPLTYTGLLTTGNYAIGGYQYQSAGRQLNVTAGGPFNSYLSNGSIGAPGQTLWLSFLLREDANPSNGQINALFLNNYSNGNSWVPQVGIGVGYFGGTAQWGLQLNNGTPILSSVPVVQGQPTLLVLSVTFGATSQVNLYVNPTSLGGPVPAAPSATFSTTSSVAFQSISYLGGYDTNISSLADIRVGSTYAAVTPMSLPLLAQNITFTPPASPVAYGVSPITLSATASSGLPVTFSIVSGPGTVSGTTLTVTATGTIVIAANQSGNANYSPAAQVTQSVVVNSAGPGTQTMNFTQPSSPVAYGVSPIALSATASSGLPVTFSIVSGPGTVSASTLTVTGTGTIVVAANQSGNANYSPAAQVTRSVVVNSGSGGSGGGTLLAYEPFGEASGTALNGVTGSGDSGWQGAWVEQFGSVAKPGYEILSTTPLTYTGLQTTGNYAIGGYQYQSAGRQLNVTAGGPFNSYLSNGSIGAPGQTLWLSFLLREDANPSNGQINALFLNNYSNGNSWVPQVGIGVGYFGGTAQWGLQLNNGTPILSSVPVVQGQPTLLVLSVTFGATSQVNLYVNPTSLGGPAPAAPSATFSTTSSVAFRSISYLGGYDTNISSLADIRVGSTYAAVTP